MRSACRNNLGDVLRRYVDRNSEKPRNAAVVIRGF
jgi:hypothetical protein